jgi:hypothetical protein
MVYKRWRDYKDRQLEVRLGGSCARAGRKNPKGYFGGGLANRQYSPSTSPMGSKSLTMPLFARTVAHAEAATETLCLETSSEGATYDRLENKAAPGRTGRSTKASRFGHGKDLITE